jgi:hypothetical protein
MSHSSTAAQRKNWNHDSYLRHRAKRNAEHRVWNEKNKFRVLMAKRIQTLALRAEVVARYGGKCVDCGTTQADVLTFDHVNDDGYLDRQKSSERDLTRKLGRQEGVDPRFELRCWNCNIKKYQRWKAQLWLWLQLYQLWCPACMKTPNKIQDIRRTA